MTETTAAPRGRVALPEISADAYLKTDYTALESIEAWVEGRFGKDAAVWEVTLKRLAVMDRKLIMLMLEHSLHETTADALLEAMTLADVADRLSDTITLQLYGRTLGEEVAHRENQAIQRVKQMEAADA